MMGNCQVRFLGEEDTVTCASLPDKDIYADCQQQNLMPLDKAWKQWLVPDKSGKRGGKPRFKNRVIFVRLHGPESILPKPERT